MGRRKRGNRSATVMEREVEGVADLATKRPRLESHQLKLQLSEDQEDRLGRWSSSVQWIMKIAQDRGSNTCLALVSSQRSDCASDACKLMMQSFDGQQVAVLVRGSWAAKAADVLARAGGEELVLLSGIGAKIPSSGTEVVFQCDRMIFEVINADNHLSQGFFEVVEGQIVSVPQAVVTIPSKPVVSDTAAISDQEDGERDDSVAEEVHDRSSPLTEIHPRISAYETPLRNNQAARQMTSVTPGWLRTPASEIPAGPALADPSSSAGESALTNSIPTRGARTAVKEKILGARSYTPIKLLKCDDKVAYNTIGLITSDHTARRALSGTRGESCTLSSRRLDDTNTSLLDWKITINLIDVEESKTPMNAPVVPFNLFSREEDWLPKSKPGSVLMLRGIKVRPFNSSPQGSGYAGQYDWAMMDTSEANADIALITSENSTLLEDESKELKRMYDWYRKHHKGQIRSVVQTRNQRPLIKLQDVEKEVFFDTTVEILKLWMGSPPEIYVTDYTAHPEFYAANDVYLDGFSREELQEQLQECNDPGNGRVLPITLWDDQQRAIDFLQVGMLVRLENVRPKMQPNNYLGGTMGGSAWRTEEKIKVIIVKDKKMVEEFQQRKDDYLQEVALKRAEKFAEMSQSTRRQESERQEEELDAESEQLNSSDIATRSGVLNLMPPPGQKPLSIIENRSFEASEASASGKTTDSRESEQEEVPTLIDDWLSSLPLVPLRRLYDTPEDQYIQEQRFLCLGRVHDMKPSNIDEIVDVTCGLCKSR
jgi:hypothetical protein